jgi:hypothetical protein
MKIWIRSQDRTMLVATDYIGVYNNEIIFGKIDYTGTLAKYSTAERAMEVLDEIQTMILFKDKNLSQQKAEITNGFSKFIKADTIVYEMPLK